MKKAPRGWRLSDLLKSCRENSTGLPDGSYVPARPLGWGGLRNRLRLAWAVFTGRADAVFWPGGQ